MQKNQDQSGQQNQSGEKTGDSRQDQTNKSGQQQQDGGKTGQQKSGNAENEAQRQQGENAERAGKNETTGK